MGGGAQGHVAGCRGVAPLQQERLVAPLQQERLVAPPGLARPVDAILAQEAMADSIEFPQGSITRFRAKKFRDTIANHIDRVWGQEVVELIKQTWSSTPCVPYSFLQAEF
ncbi:hypothetical protein PVK06_017451 [Gossypium arboreum]|uniref:Uncharacterized protein n=1 Tax=Gossypium arboreum TaxID=29729 RepID=A0ABR0Q368_GOSAR|nr:hypothetical protein PVK06_017451 [Gossypium arboreum]